MGLPLVVAGSSAESGWPDSNRRPPVPQTGALTRLRHSPFALNLGADHSAALCPEPHRGFEPRPLPYEGSVPPPAPMRRDQKLVLGSRDRRGRGSGLACLLEDPTPLVLGEKTAEGAYLAHLDRPEVEAAHRLSQSGDVA